YQADDGIRDFHVTGVQTCALPIWCGTPTFLSRPARTRTGPERSKSRIPTRNSWSSTSPGITPERRSRSSQTSERRSSGCMTRKRSEERREGKDERTTGATDDGKSG